MMATGNVGTVIKDLKGRLSGIAAALISRDGLVLYADVPAGVYTETFAIMCATILGAAATANTELNRAPPDRIVIEGNDSKTIIVGSGKKALLVVVVDQGADANKVLAEAAKVADLLKTG
ncbi:MAG: roadblock/LC7 domain-containing protein [Thermoplasmata archaeon]|jgi:predicted regulator of Ras-like GTPase activity (Roadblock/LC7/MglB family)|nr:roadblock/LC7 domain-containing protein [Thermoplasmata archaeon]MCI4338580.1 roadblock/LC7 domain-containing protein [Thermoplasmata archaeon]MCI4341886.1 roadblock/LC7 domain-containing protein [Thermoplasmata archaeon]